MLRSTARIAAMLLSGCGQAELAEGGDDLADNFFSSSSIAGKCFGRSPNGGAWAAGALPSRAPAGLNPSP